MKQIGRVMLCTLFLLGTLILSCNNGGFNGDDEKKGGGGGEGKDSNKLVIEPKAQLTSVGESVSFKAYLKGEDVTDKVSWSSADKSVAKVGKAGVFNAVDIGVVDVEASLDKETVNATLSVERAEELENAEHYARLVYGIENCYGGTRDQDRSHEPCLGDCDDAWLVIEGELSVGTSKGKTYITSAKKQSISFTTYQGTWNWSNASTNWGNDIDPVGSLVKIKIKDRFNHEVKSNSLQMRRTDALAGSSQDDINGDGTFRVEVQKKYISVEKGYAIDIRTSFTGSAIGTDGCPHSSYILTGNRYADYGFYRRDEDNTTCVNGYKYCCSVAAKNMGHCSAIKQ